MRLRAVGQFRELVEAAEKDRPLCETLKKVLKLTKVPPLIEQKLWTVPQVAVRRSSVCKPGQASAHDAVARNMHKLSLQSLLCTMVSVPCRCHTCA